MVRLRHTRCTHYDSHVRLGSSKRKLCPAAVDEDVVLPQGPPYMMVRLDPARRDLKGPWIARFSQSAGEGKPRMR